VNRFYGRARTQPRRDGSMNRMEAQYAATLEGQRVAGAIAAWSFQPEKLRLADRTFYEPDFRVIENDGTVRFDEVKGFMEDDAAVKIKVAAEQHPYRFFLIRARAKKHGGGWERTEI
jgi:hypothetical protein